MRFCLQLLISQPMQTLFFVSSTLGRKKMTTHGGPVDNQISKQQFREAVSCPQYSSGWLDCKSRKYESIMFGGTPCKRSLQKDNPPREMKRKRQKSKPFM
jgi:hypothetical protein